MIALIRLIGAVAIALFPTTVVLSPPVAPYAEAAAAPDTTSARGYLVRECTDYVAEIEADRAFVVPDWMGDATAWPAAAASRGIVVDQVPALGAGVVWGAGVDGAGSAGHVAILVAVSLGEGRPSVWHVDEYNWAVPDGFDTRALTVADLATAQVLHFVRGAP